MTTRFILSLDCEGKWGVADHLDRNVHAALNDSSLRQVYQKVVGLLDEYALPATFAFVGCFAEKKAALNSRIDSLRRFELIAPSYIGPVLKDLSEGSGQGWHGDWAVEAVGGAEVAHEIALHGVTHVPWTELGQSGAELEMALLGEMETPVRNARTFIYPRNRVAHRDVLATARIEAYRRAPPRRSRFPALLSEFNIFEQPEKDPTQDEELVAIPAGIFVNWRSGARRLVPTRVSLERARRMMERAEETGGIVHYWLHPENLATAPSTFELLRGIVRLAADRRSAGRCTVLTQLQYATSVRATPGRS